MPYHESEATQPTLLEPYQSSKREPMQAKLRVEIPCSRAVPAINEMMPFYRLWDNARGPGCFFFFFLACSRTKRHCFLADCMPLFDYRGSFSLNCNRWSESTMVYLLYKAASQIVQLRMLFPLN